MATTVAAPKRQGTVLCLYRPAFRYFSTKPLLVPVRRLSCRTDKPLSYIFFIYCSFFFFSIIWFVNEFLSNFICGQHYSINQGGKFMSYCGFPNPRITTNYDNQFRRNYFLLDFLCYSSQYLPYLIIASAR